MISRRQALALCGCAACSPLLFSGISAQEDDEFFYCGTPQITSIGVGQENFSAAGQTGGENFGGVGSSTEGDNYATATKALRWTTAKTREQRNGNPLVLIYFKDGSSEERQRVQDLAQPWLQHNILVSFDFTNDVAKSDIRISFSGGVNKSKTGIEAVDFPGETTMWLPDVRSRPGTTAARRAVLHEFGHGLMAFGHEHRHPDAGYRFRPAAEIATIINASLPPGATEWTASMVETNITNPPYASSRVCTDYDTSSIMHYPVAPSWLIAGTPVPSPATTLSQLDVACATETYSS